MAALATVEFTYSRRTLVHSAKGLAPIAAFMGAAAFAEPLGIAFRVLAALVAALLSYVSVTSAWTARRADRTVITLTATGVTDVRVAQREVPWLDVADVLDFRRGREEYVALIVEERVWDASQVGKIRCWARPINRRINIDALFVSARPTTTTHDHLLAAMRRYWRAAHASATTN